jgi:hypothetical protein
VWYPIGTGTHGHSDYITAASAINPTIVDAKGDIIAATAADTVARLAVGANDTVLTADSSTATGLKWATPAAGGMTLISTTTLTGASVTLSSIPATYNNLQLVIRNFRPATNGQDLGLRFNSSTTGYFFWRTDAINDGSASQTPGASYIKIMGSNSSIVSTGISNVFIPDYGNAVTWKMANIQTMGINSTTTTDFTPLNGIGILNNSAAITGITLLPSSGNFTSGTALLYGVK